MRRRNADVRQKLARVLELAPNHFSAKLLLTVADDGQPRKLSAGHPSITRRSPCGT